MRVFQLILLLTMLMAVGDLRAQSYSVRMHRSDGPDSLLNAVLKPPATFSNQLAALDFTQQIVPRLQEAGYLAASLDSFGVKERSYEVLVYAGQQWKWVRLSLAGLPPGLLLSAGISETQYAGRPLNAGSISRLTERLLRWCDDNGYPFARTGLDSIVENTPGGISARLILDNGPQSRIDSIITEGDVRLSRSFLMRYLDIWEGKPYNESRIRKIDQRLRELPFLHERSGSRVAFRITDTKLYLNLRERRANQLDALFGLQPNNLENGKFLLTIDAKAALQNILGNGESFSFSFQNLQVKSPRIRAEAAYPYILGTPFGADAHFDLYFRNEDFRRTSFDIGGRYALSAHDFLRVYYRNNSNRVISPDTAYIVAFRRLPENIDINSAGGGIGLQVLRTDYSPNPSKGWLTRISGEALKRTVRKNDGITGIRDGSGFDFSRLYDSVDAESYQYRVSGDVACYIKVAKRIVLKGAYAGGWMSGERLFQNEMFQLGGFRLLRGFDEGSLFVNQYHVGTAELRFILGRNSNVYLFSDNGWLQSKINKVLSEGLYNGFGVGASLETATGVFSIAYALGRSPANPVQLRQSKIHIGYAAYF